MRALVSGMVVAMRGRTAVSRQVDDRTIQTAPNPRDEYGCECGCPRAPFLFHLLVPKGKRLT